MSKNETEKIHLELEKSNKISTCNLSNESGSVILQHIALNKKQSLVITNLACFVVCLKLHLVVIVALTHENHMILNPLLSNPSRRQVFKCLNNVHDELSH